VTSDSVIAPTPDGGRGPHLVGAELLERTDDGFDRALHVALDDERESLRPRS
jgi:hypothetical protein